LKTPLVSVIIPLYNAQKYVAESIQSIINQTHTNWELIIVNDGSTDNGLEVAQKFESDKIKVFSQKNKGASAARNYGIREAKGEYIQFLDADDLLSTNKIERQIEALEDKQDCISICNSVHFFNGEDAFSIKPSNDEAKYLFTTDKPIDFLINLYGGNGEGGMITVHSWLTPLSLIRKTGFWNEELSLDDDGEYFCRVVLASKHISYIHNAISYYRKFKNVETLSGQKNKKAMKSAVFSTQLKEKHLLNTSNSTNTKKVLAKLYQENLITIYPKYHDLALICESKIQELGGIQRNVFYTHTPFYKLITYLFGWKVSAWITHLKNNIL
jgi:glycosyltransferase involved in cell wall biosynthesis